MITCCQLQRSSPAHHVLCSYAEARGWTAPPSTRSCSYKRVKGRSHCVEELFESIIGVGWSSRVGRAHYDTGFAEPVFMV